MARARGPRRACIHVIHRGIRRTLCRVAFVTRDASLYLLPADNDFDWYAGRREFTGPLQKALSFHYVGDALTGTGPAKLSIHESGQVHVQLNGRRTKPVLLPALAKRAGEHVATIHPDSLDVLPLHTGHLRGKGRERDYVLALDDAAASAAVAVFVTSGRIPHVSNRSLVAELARETLSEPLYVEFRPIAKEELGGQSPYGLTVVSGFHPTEPRDPFLFIRADHKAGTHIRPWALLKPPRHYHR